MSGALKRRNQAISGNFVKNLVIWIKLASSVQRMI